MTRSAAARRFAPAIVLAALLVALARPAGSAAQAGADLMITKVDASGYPRIEVSIAAPGGSLDALSTTQPVHIEQTIGSTSSVLTPTLELEHPGVALLVLVDLHRRMRGIGMPISPTESLNRLDTARAAIVRLAQALEADQPGANQLGVIAYHRDLIEVMPLQPLKPGLAEGYIQPGDRQRLFDIERKKWISAPNDPADPHAKSALERAVRSAENMLAAQVPAHQQRAIVIIGATCTDLSDELADRTDVTCDSTEPAQASIKERSPAELPTIYGVGVGSNDPKLPQVRPQDKEDGFNYPSNFHQIELLAGPGRFVVLHTADLAQVDNIWKKFDDTVVAPIQAQSAQLKVAFDLLPSPAGTNPLTATIEIELQNRALPAQQIALPQLDLLIDGAPVVSSTLQLAPGQHNLAARYTGAAAAVPPRSVQLTVPKTDTPSAPCDQKNSPLPAACIIERMSVFTSILALLVALIALFYWFSLSRNLGVPASQSQALPNEDKTLSLSDDDRQKLLKQPNTNKHYLQQIFGPQPGAIIPLLATPMRIGSDRDRVHIYVDDPYISPTHATLDLVNDRLTITDNASENGTIVNSGSKLRPGEPFELEDNAQIMLGWVTFCYLHVAIPPHPITLRTPARGATGQLKPVE